MRIHRLFLLICSMIFGLFTIQAQSTNYSYGELRHYLDQMFLYLNKNKVPTGILLDYGIDYVDLGDYNGRSLTDTTCVNISTYRDIMRTISSANVRPFISYDYQLNNIDLFENINNTDDINLSVMYYQYNTIKENALTDNLIVYDEERNIVADVYNNGEWINPYDTNNIFAFVTNSTKHIGFAVNYTLPSIFLFKNAEFKEMYFDAGDGNGYKRIGVGNHLSVTYNTEGVKTLKLSIITQDNELLEAQTRITITNPTIHPCSDENLRTIDYTSSEFNGEAVSARLVYDANMVGTINKPFIVVEGFDPWELCDLFDYNMKQYDSSSIPSGFLTYSNYGDTFSMLHNEYDYDVFYVDLGNSTADIRANALLLQNIIKDINYKKSCAGSNENNVILGLSMGGLVARYALRNMEINGEEHQVSTYVSGDTPHLGVNVPIGIQVFVNQLLSLMAGYRNTVDIMDEYYNDKLTEKERVLKSVITSTAAQQMMYYCAYGESITSFHHENWQQIINDIGFPKGDKYSDIELISLANKTSFDYNKYLTTGEHIFYINGNLRANAIVDLLMSLYLKFNDYDNLDNDIEDALQTFGRNNIEIDAQVNLLQENNIGKPLSYLEVVHEKKFVWNKNKTKRTIIFSGNVPVPAVPLFYEDYGGSLYRMDALKNGNYHNHYQSWFYNHSFEGGFTHQFLFVPTASALNVYGGTKTDYNIDFNNKYLIPRVDTPFDAYYIDSDTSANTDTDVHIRFSQNAYHWLMNQINMSIEGPELVPLKDECANESGEGEYYISGFNDEITNISWSVDDKSIATIEPSTGKLTAISRGKVDITAKIFVGRTIYSKTKSIYVGFPDFVIIKRYEPGIGYNFSARLITDNNAHLKDVCNDTDIEYKWSIIDNNGDCRDVDEDMINDDSFTYLPSVDETITVLLRIKYGDNNYGPIRSVTVNLTAPFDVNYQYVVVDPTGTVSFVKNGGGFDRNIPSEDFTIHFRNVILNDNDNLLTNYHKYIKGADCYMSVHNLENGYLVDIGGDKIKLEDKWRFDLFNLPVFVQAIENALQYCGGERHVLTEFELVIKNSEYKVLQRVPFRIIYNPVFNSIY